MKNAIELNEMELDLVNGGDYGDADTDNGAAPRYKVGSYVEFYNTPLHITTKTVVILNATKRNGHWVYEINEDFMCLRRGNMDPTHAAQPNRMNKIINADYIESN